MKTIRFKIEGTSPLLMHDDKTANPLHPNTKALKELTGKRKKTDEDHYNIARIEFLSSLYYRKFNGKQNGYFIKAECFEATFRNAAKKDKMGIIFKEGVTIRENPDLNFPQWKLTPEELFIIDEYRDHRTVVVEGRRVMRCRPIFNKWDCVVEIWYDEDRLNERDIIRFVEYASRYIGVCDYRPKYGRFTATKLD